MTNASGVYAARIIARSGVVLMGRVVGYDATSINQSAVNSLTYQIRDLESKSSGVVIPLVVGDCIFNSLQTGGGWDADSVGYNFRTTLPAGTFVWEPELDSAGNPKPRRFQVEIRLVPTSGEPYFLVWDLFVYPTWMGGTP
jgi:hypothetical protein